MNNKLRFTFSDLPRARTGRHYTKDDLLVFGVTPSHRSKTGVTTYAMSFSVSVRLAEQAGWDNDTRLDVTIDLSSNTGALFPADNPGRGRKMYNTNRRRESMRRYLKFHLPYEVDPWREKLPPLTCGEVEVDKESGMVAFSLPKRS